MLHLQLITGSQDKVFGLTDFSQLEEIVDALQRSIISSLEGKLLRIAEYRNKNFTTSFTCIFL